MNCATTATRLLGCVNVRRAIQVLGVSLVPLLISLPLFPQANQGTIQGSVYDQTGGAIAGATVTVIDVARGVSTPLATDSAGLYVAPNLIPGTYTVRGEAKGFQTLEHAQIVLGVGQTVRVDLVMQPGAQTQTVTVTSEAVAVNASDATLGGTVSQQTISDLPMSGRDFKTLLALTPGVFQNEGGNTVTVTANGIRTDDVGYMVDGLKADGSYSGQSIINSNIAEGDVATALPFEAIQEVNTVENPKAENGWKPGSVVNMGLKSGSNTLHGTAFAMGRDTSLDARNFFNTPPQLKAPIAFESYGGSAGGRIVKDKLFWFVAYEGQQYTVTNTLPTSLPVTTLLPNTPANVTVSLVNACLAAGPAAITPLSAHLAGITNTTTCTIAPQNFTLGPNLSLFPANSSTSPVFLSCGNSAKNDNGIGKLDYHINDHHTVHGFFYYARGYGNFTSVGTDCIPDTAQTPFGAAYGPIIPQLLSGTWTWTPSSTRINEFRLGYSHLNQPYYATDYQVNPLAFGANTGVTQPVAFGFPAIAITGYTLAFGGGQHKIVGPELDLQLLDHYSLVRGNHSFKFGGEFINNHVTSTPNSGGQGSFTFSNLESFLEGAVFSSKLLVGNVTRTVENQQYALFAQDDWRVSRRVIVNLGLRWEYTSVIKLADDQVGNFSPTLGLEQVGDQIKSPYNGDFKDFSPRVGVAWDIFGNGKTVARAGGSLMFSSIPLQMFMSTAQVMGITQTPTGATIIDAACPAPVGCPGSGNIATSNVTFSGTATAPITASWQAQTANCVNNSLTTCGTLFPASTLNLECGDGLTVGGVKDPPPCTTEIVNPNLQSPYVGTWTAGIQRAVTNSLFLNASYVGTHGGGQPGVVNINEAPYGSGFTAIQIATGDPSAVNTSVNEQQSRPFYSKFPYLADLNELTNNSISNYNALQLTLEQRAWHGLSFLVGYTYSHTNADWESDTFDRVPFDSNQPQLQYGPAEFDIHNRFTFTTTYLLPGRKGWGQMLEGWQINSVVKLNSGEPWTPTDSSNDLNGTGEVSNLAYYGQLWDFSGNPADFSRLGPAPFPCWQGSSAKAKLSGCNLSIGSGAATEPQQCLSAANALGANAVAALNEIGCYVVGNSVLIPPALGTNGNTKIGEFRGPGFANWDFSLIKDWKLKERLDVQFRGEIFNILNHPNFFNLGQLPNRSAYSTANSGFNGDFGCTCTTPDQGAGNPVLGTGGARAGYLEMRFIF